MKVLIVPKENSSKSFWIELPKNDNEIDKMINEYSNYVIYDVDIPGIDLSDISIDKLKILNRMAKLIDEDETNEYKIRLLFILGYNLNEIELWLNLIEKEVDDITIIDLRDYSGYFSSTEEKLAQYYMDYELLPELPKFYEPFIDYVKLGETLMNEYIKIEDDILGMLP